MSRLVVVTGGTRGIGRAVAERFAAAGDRVIAVGRGAPPADDGHGGRRADESGAPPADEGHGGRRADESGAPPAGAPAGVAVETCDVTNEIAVSVLFDRLGPVDVLVNNAGVSASAPLGRTTLEAWLRQLDVNATGAFLCTRAVLEGMRERDSGRIVTVASVNGRAGARYTSAYTASKHAAVGLMRAVAAEVAGTGVTANAVCPGYVRTDMTTHTIENIEARTGRDGEAALAALSPLGRLLEPAEIAFAVAFLAAPEAGAINGQTLILDGGGIQS